ncbi:MAG: hypothetical protein F6K00_33815 [Leptolyngbya sp. SIOISBB]|nr:hypothetical protein [Leptolyngbya sp. SIOISBB]
MQPFAALFHEVVSIMLRKIALLTVLLLLGVGLVGFDGCDISPTMQEVEVEAEASSADELADALELAQEYGAIVVEYGATRLVVCFDNKELAQAYVRRVNQATKTLTALIDNLCVTVTSD